jgi:hypothetical protein
VTQNAGFKNAREWVSMKANVRNFQDLFDRTIRFAVPIFQRGYVWTQEANWAPLWAELLQARDRPDEGCFLGAVVLEQASVATGVTEVRRIVDGQQRLTTIQVVLAVLRDVAADLGQLDLVARLTALTTNPRAATAEEELKIWLGRADRPAFRAALCTGGPAALAAEYPGPAPEIVKAYRFFHRELLATLASGPTDERVTTLGRLTDAVITGLTVIVLDLERPDDPQAIFETLNALGTPLRAGDLVRNHLFHECARMGLSVEELHTRYWAPFDDEYWQTKPSESGDGRLNAFLSDYLLIENRRPLLQPRLYPEFRAYLRTCGRPLVDVMARLAGYAAVYASLDTDADLTPDEAVIAGRLRDVRINVLRPVILRLFDHEDPTQRLVALKAIESYVLRRYALGLPTRSYAALVPALLGRLDGVGPPGPAVVAELAGRGGELRWPTDVDLADYLREEGIYETAPQRVRVLLLVAEAQLRRKSWEEVVVKTDKLTIEHLMPRVPRGNSWAVPETDPAARAQEEEARRTVLHTLGNLSLVTEDLNQDLKSRPWTEKRPRLHAGSSLHVNRNLDRVWNAAAIRRRSGQLAALLCAALPRPAPARPAATTPVSTRPASTRPVAMTPVAMTPVDTTPPVITPPAPTPARVPPPFPVLPAGGTSAGPVEPGGTP